MEDAILGGRLRLRQPARGHRAGTDAVLLAAAIGLTEGVLEAGGDVPRGEEDAVEGDGRPFGRAE